MKQRIEYLDTTKGLLMFLLIWGHIIVFAKTLGIESDFSQTIQNTVPFYRVFFMQTFFVITGFCTSWGISFKEFLPKNLKTIILPAFIFLPFAYCTQLIIRESFGLDSFCNLLMKYLIDGTPWFLSALFFSKLIYWTIKKYVHNSLAEWSVVFLLFAIGLSIKEYSSIPNHWSYQHALVMLPFLCLGSNLKLWNAIDSIPLISRMGGVMSKRTLLFATLPYFAVIILWQILGLGLGFPAVDAFLDIHVITAPFHLALATGGTALIFLIAQQLQSVAFIKVIGRQSLFVYLIHTFVVFGLMKIAMLLNIPTATYSDGMIFYLSIYVLSFTLLYIGCRLMETKYLSWMVGKF